MSDVTPSMPAHYKVPEFLEFDFKEKHYEYVKVCGISVISMSHLPVWHASLDFCLENLAFLAMLLKKPTMFQSLCSALLQLKYYKVFKAATLINDPTLINVTYTLQLPPQMSVTLNSSFTHET